jgi:hypothetical protein
MLGTGSWTFGDDGQSVLTVIYPVLVRTVRADPRTRGQKSQRRKKNIFFFDFFLFVRTERGLFFPLKTTILGEKWWSVRNYADCTDFKRITVSPGK